MSIKVISKKIFDLLISFAQFLYVFSSFRPKLFSLIVFDLLLSAVGASDGVMASRFDEQTYSSEFESHWVPLSYVLRPQNWGL